MINMIIIGVVLGIIAYLVIKEYHKLTKLAVPTNPDLTDRAIWVQVAASLKDSHPALVPCVMNILHISDEVHLAKMLDGEEECPAWVKHVFERRFHKVAAIRTVTIGEHSEKIYGPWSHVGTKVGFSSPVIITNEQEEDAITALRRMESSGVKFVQLFSTKIPYMYTLDSCIETFEKQVDL